MTKLEERLAQLRGDIEDLRLKQDECESDYKKSEEVYKFSMKVNANYTTNRNYELKSKAVMDLLEKRVTLLRSQIDIIRRISPQIVNDLEDRLNHVDKLRLDSVKLLDGHFNKINNNQFRIDNQDDVERLKKNR